MFGAPPELSAKGLLRALDKRSSISESPSKVTVLCTLVLRASARNVSARSRGTTKAQGVGSQRASVPSAATLAPGGTVCTRTSTVARSPGTARVMLVLPKG